MVNTTEAALIDRYSQRPTWALVRPLRACWRTEVKRSTDVGFWKWTPTGLWRMGTARRSKMKQRAITYVLEYRYRGVVAEVIDAAGGKYLPHLDASDGFIQVNSIMWRNLRMQRSVSWLTFSEALWLCLEDALRSTLENPSIAASRRLKPKFMLRQFVDQLQPAEGRGVMRTHNFGGVCCKEKPWPEAALMLQPTAQQLLIVLQDNQRLLGELTGGTLALPAQRVELDPWLNAILYT